MMIATSLYNNSFDNEFRRYLFYGIVSYILIGSFTLSQFKIAYLNVITFISLLSLIIYTSSYFISLPLQYIVGETLSLGHFYFHTIEWNYYPLERNASMFSEPGCFQYCLNYTLLFFLEDLINKRLDRVTIVKLIIVVITLITCASTTGYMVLMALMIIAFFKYKSKRKIYMVLIGLPLMLFALWWIYNSDSIKGKFEEQNNDKASFVMRSADAYAMIQMINDHPLIGNGGVDTKTYKKRVLRYGALTADHGATNGVLVGMAMFGCFWLVLYSFFCYRACRQFYSEINPWIIVSLTLLIHTNEYFIFSPIIYTFIFPFKKD